MESARAVETALLKAGCDGGSGGGFCHSSFCDDPNTQNKGTTFATTNGVFWLKNPQFDVVRKSQFSYNSRT